MVVHVILDLNHFAFGCFEPKIITLLYFNHLMLVVYLDFQRFFWELYEINAISCQRQYFQPFTATIFHKNSPTTGCSKQKVATIEGKCFVTVDGCIRQEISPVCTSKNQKVKKTAVIYILLETEKVRKQSTRF